jgi:hypothetical protein
MQALASEGFGLAERSKETKSLAAKNHRLGKPLLLVVCDHSFGGLVLRILAFCL